MEILEGVNQNIKNSPAYPQWQRIGIRHHHGVNLPLFSLHSAKSAGIGEFPDLLPLITWCRQIGMDLIQLLPLNDSGMDASPYNAISAFALNPIHLGLATLPEIGKYPDLAASLKELQQLTTSQRVLYPRLQAERLAFLKAYDQKEGQNIRKTASFQQFKQKQAFWLKGYALFKSLKSSFGWENAWESWPQEIAHPNSATLQALEKQFQEEIDFHSLVQYLCFQQLHEVKSQASIHQVLIKGDIPILISRDSADVWLNRQLFNLDYAAGAPPDMYNVDGQNWGFPLYDWGVMEREGYWWWKERLKVAQDFYHLYRLDHVVGFFRLWAIPKGKSAKEGLFIPQDFTTWIPAGQKLLKMLLESSTMLPIGEDLGIIPPPVRVCLKELGICGTRVMRWERMWDEDRRFIKLEDYLPMSMTTISTHDSDTLYLWWAHEPKDVADFAAFKGWPVSTTLSLEHQQEMLRDSHHTASLFHINLLQEYLTLVPGMTWPDPEDERINVPGTISDRNWSYRFRPSVEELVQSDPLKKVMQDIVGN